MAKIDKNDDKYIYYIVKSVMLQSCNKIIEVIDF